MYVPVVASMPAGARSASANVTIQASKLSSRRLGGASVAQQPERKLRECAQRARPEGIVGVVDDRGERGGGEMHNSTCPLWLLWLDLYT